MEPHCVELLYSQRKLKLLNFSFSFFADFNKMYELYDPCTVMFFFRNKHIMIDLGTGNNNKINWAMEDKKVWFGQERNLRWRFWVGWSSLWLAQLAFALDQIDQFKNVLDHYTAHSSLVETLKRLLGVPILNQYVAFSLLYSVNNYCNWCSWCSTVYFRDKRTI